jgi:hypothetical protein
MKEGCSILNNTHVTTIALCCVTLCDVNQLPMRLNSSLLEEM